MTPCRSRWTIGIAGLALAAVLQPAIAQAVCPPNAIPNALSGRLDVSAFSILKGPLLPKLPTNLVIPELPISPFVGQTITPRQGKVTFVIHDINFAPEDKGVRVTVALDVRGTASLDYQSIIFTNTVCDSAFSAVNVVFDAIIQPGVNDCVATFPFAELRVIVAPADVVATLANCTNSGSIYAELLKLVQGSDWLVSMLASAVSSAITTMLPPIVDKLSQAFFSTDFNVPDAGLRFNIVPERVTTDTHGLTATFAADLVLDPVHASSCMPIGGELPDRSDLTPDAPIFSDSALSLVVSRPLLQRVLDNAWLTGWLCLDSKELNIDLGSYVAAVVPNAKVDFKIMSTTAPTLELAPEPGRHARLATDNLTATLSIQIGQGEPTVANAAVKASIQGDVGVSTTMRALTLQPREITASSVQVTVPGASLGISQESVSGFLQNLVLPAFGKKIGALPISSSVLLTAPFAFCVDRIEAAPGQVRADLSLWPIEAEDTVPPETKLAHPPLRPSPADVVLDFASTDDMTPDKFIRHTVWVDGVRQEALTPGQRLVVVGVKGGVRSFKVVAVDVAGNEDPTPFVTSVLVDDQAPVITIADAPLGGFDGAPTTVHFGATDDRTSAGELTFRYTLGIVSRANEPDTMLVQGDLASEHSVSFSDLPDAAFVRLTVFGKDAAGNEGSAQAAFLVDRAPQLGCAAALPPMSLFACLVAWLAWRRRARLRGARA